MNRYHPLHIQTKSRLGHRFPKTQFSIRSVSADTYSVRWIDGPPSDMVLSELTPLEMQFNVIFLPDRQYSKSAIQTAVSLVQASGPIERVPILPDARLGHAPLVTSLKLYQLILEAARKLDLRDEEE